MTDILIDKLYTKIAERELENIMEKTRLMVGFAPEDYEIVDKKEQTYGVFGNNGNGNRFCLRYFA